MDEQTPCSWALCWSVPLLLRLLRSQLRKESILHLPLPTIVRVLHRRGRLRRYSGSQLLADSYARPRSIIYTHIASRDKGVERKNDVGKFFLFLTYFYIYFLEEELYFFSVWYNKKLVISEGECSLRVVEEHNNKSLQQKSVELYYSKWKGNKQDLRTRVEFEVLDILARDKGGEFLPFSRWSFYNIFDISIKF